MKKNIFKKGFVFMIFILFMCGVVVSAFSVNLTDISKSMNQGNWLFVGGSGPGNYSKIQNALDAADYGDTVFVYNGRYYENIMIAKSITLIGEDKNTTIIDGTCSNSVIIIVADRVNITGFTITNGSKANWKQAGIEIYSWYNNITGNIITKNRVGIHPLFGRGENTYLRGNNIFQDNILMDNEMDAFCVHSAHNIINHNHIENNGGGIYLWTNCFFNIVKQNNLINNSYNGGFNDAFLNKWDGNYWDDWIGLKNPLFRCFPKVIKRTFGIVRWYVFDWHPAKKPYIIV